MFKNKFRTLKYEIVNIDSESGSKPITKFYEGVETITKRKFLIFGNKIIKKQPKFIFDLPLDITNDKYNKQEINLKLFKKLELLDKQNKNGVKNGNIKTAICKVIS